MAERNFSIWPFEGTLDLIRRRGEIAVGEIYARAAYATCLAEVLPARPLVLAKTRQAVRDEAVRILQGSSWVAEHQVRLRDQERAIENEDDFDAMTSAAALLRVVLEDLSVSDPTLDDQVAEDGILCTCTLDFNKRPRIRRARPRS